MTVGKRIAAAENTLEKVSKGDATCCKPLSAFEKLLQHWPEKEQKPVLVLQALCLLAKENPDVVGHGFTSNDIVEKVEKITGHS